MSNADRVRLCRRLALRAHKLASLASPNNREPFLKIARDGRSAHEMERLDQHVSRVPACGCLLGLGSFYKVIGTAHLLVRELPL